MQRRLFTSESVTEGHPDKMADAISDTILDAMLEQDPLSRVAIETLVTTGQVHIAGEVTTESYVDIPTLVRNKILEIGYNDSAKGFDGRSCGISVSIDRQSPDIALGVDRALEFIGNTEDQDNQIGAGDQGLMFGYATDETETYMPMPIAIAHALAERLAFVRKNEILKFLRPDGKTQVTVAYEFGEPVAVETIVVSSQHDNIPAIQNQIRRGIQAEVIKPVLEQFDIDASKYNLLVNPTGRFVIGGPQGDAGLTGRKIIVDSYGGMARHGGGAFSGKDATKVDRSAAYAMRWIAKNVVAAGLADKCEIQVAYAIGKARPVGLYLETFGTETYPVERIQDAIQDTFDLRPRAIIGQLDLRRPIFSKTSAYGHFGRELPEFTWENTDKVNQLLNAI